MPELPEIDQTPEAAQEAELIKCLQESANGELNNGTLRERLGWNAELFWAVRSRLLASGKVIKARGGPGGMTILAAPLEQQQEPAAIEPSITNIETYAGEEGREQESDLYDPMLKEIDSNWSQDEGYDACITRKTALAGRRQTGGKWTRPDICMVGIRKFKFLRDPIFDVISFEVKPAWAVTVEGVFEALAHRQFATRAYAVFHIDAANFVLRPEASRIVALAEQHGVGVILAEDAKNYDTWVEKVYGRRWSPDPVDLNDFIQRIFPSSDHDQIIKFTK